VATIEANEKALKKPLDASKLQRSTRPNALLEIRGKKLEIRGWFTSEVFNSLF
jgi:hypothetical protein